MVAELSFRKLNALNLVEKVAEGKKYDNGKEIRVAPPNSFLPTIDAAAGHQLSSIPLMSEAHYENGIFEVPQFSILNDDMAGS